MRGSRNVDGPDFGRGATGTGEDRGAGGVEDVDGGGGVCGRVAMVTENADGEEGAYPVGENVNMAGRERKLREVEVASVGRGGGTSVRESDVNGCCGGEDITE